MGTIYHSQNKHEEIIFSEKEANNGVWVDSRRHDKVRERLIARLGNILSKNHLILDAGCGPGTYGMLLAQTGYKVIGVDISSKLLKLSRTRAKRVGCNFPVVLCDLENLPFKEGTFDICLCAYTLHHFPSIFTVISNLKSCSKPRAKIVIVEPNGINIGIKLSGKIEDIIRDFLNKFGLDTSNEKLYSLEEYVEALSKIGFDTLLTQTLRSEGLPPLPRKSENGGLASLSLILVYIVAHVRFVLFTLIDFLVTDSLSHANLIIVGSKRD
jgi:ubiquinone/menaquinone biosynthesis C-methylase UbiE